MWKLKLAGLSETEQALIRSIVRLSKDLESSWQVVDQGACDAVLCGTHGPAMVMPGVLRIRVAEPGEHCTAYMHDVLERPIRAERLIRLLCQSGAALAQGRPSNTPASTPSISSPVVAETPAPRAMHGSLHQVASIGCWPPQAVLAKNREFIRLAVVLARASLSVTELSRLSGVPMETCISFLDALEERSLVRWGGAEDAIPPPPSHLQESTEHRHFGSGLLGSIRRALGI
ncbi:hypothetical protein [Zoogloea sp.]|uniref:hypothetical protein n=1 Tax=Zoogloea sp. TaxID=49181 RepID=UPI0035B4DCCD